MTTERRTAVRVLLGLLLAALVLAALLVFVGIDDVLASLAGVGPVRLAGIVAVALCWLAFWGLSLSVVLSILGVETSIPRALFAFTTVVFANSVMPFGQLGGEPLAAFFLSRATRTEYETSLVATASVDSLNLLPSSLFVLVGAALLASTGQPLHGSVELAVGIVLGLSVALVLVAVVVWWKRDRLRSAGVTAATAVGRVVTRVAPTRRVPSHRAIGRRIDRLFGSIERLFDNPRLIAVGFGLSLLGWAFFVASFWLSLSAVGVDVPFAVAMLVVPTSMVAVVLPSPGGLGGVEAMLVLLTVSLSGASPASATAAALVHRGATHLVPILLGATAVGVLSSGSPIRGT